MIRAGPALRDSHAGALSWTVVALRAIPVLMLLLLIAPVPFSLLLTHPPVRPLQVSPTESGLTFEEVSFSSPADGTHLRGWYLPGSSGERTVILVHGWVNDRLIHGRGLPLARALIREGYSVLLFDLRGHGQSQRARVTLGAHEQGDVSGAVDFARQRGARQIGVVGFSIGAVATLLAAADEPAISVIVSDSAFTNLNSFLAGQVTERLHLPQGYAAYALWVYRLVSGIDPGGVAPLAAAPRLAGRPVLFIHGTDDRVIPFKESQRLQSALQGSELWLVPGARHTHSFEADPERYTERILGFLAQHMTVARSESHVLKPYQ